MNEIPLIHLTDEQGYFFIETYYFNIFRNYSVKYALK